VIAIGPDAAADFLTQLAQRSGGRALVPADLRELPAVVAGEAVRSVGGLEVTETFTPRATDHSVTAGIRRGMLPPLHGYFVTALKPKAEPVLVSHLDDPVFAVWRDGLGSVGAFTSDMHGPWASALVRWSGFGPLWRQALSWLGRRTADRLQRVSLVDAPEGPRLVVDAQRADGRFASLLDVRATVRDPAGETHALALSPTAPGRYEASIAAGPTGPYLASVAIRDPAGAESSVLRGLYWSADRERVDQGADLTALATLAAISGGAILDATHDPFTGPRPLDDREALAWLAAAALIVFVAEAARHRRRAVAALVSAVTRPASSSGGWRG
jgi:hypothetical protein